MNRNYIKEQIVNDVIRYDSDSEPIVYRLAERARGGWIFDFRRVLLTYEWLDAYAELFWDKYKNHYPFQVGSIEAAGIALVAAIVAKGKVRGTPVNGFFIRKSRKKDGLMRSIEGELSTEPIILVDDLINTGSSVMKQVLALAELGRHVDEVFVLVSFRDKDAYRAITDHGIRLSWEFHLSEFDLSLLQKPTPEFDTLSHQWKFQAARPSFNHVTEKSAPIIDAENIYFGTDSGVFYALSRHTGTVSWSFATRQDAHEKGIFSSPALHGETIFFGSYDGNFYALNSRSGSPLWTYHRADWIGSSPTVAPERGLIFVGLEFSSPGKKGALVALKMDTGEEVWMSEFSEFVHSSPHYIPNLGIVVCADNSGEVRALDALTGTVRWSIRTGGAIKASFGHDPKRGLIFFGSFDGHLYAVNAWSGHITFAFKTGEPIFSTPHVKNGAVLIASLDKYIYAIDSVMGKELWRTETKGRIFASPVFAFGSIWIGSNDACLYEIDPESGAIRSIQRFSERIVNAIAFDENLGHIYVPTVANEIYCLKKQNPSQ